MNRVHSSISSFRRLPPAATAAVVVCLLLECIVAHVRPWLMDGVFQTVDIKRGMLVDSRLQEDVVFFGDSRAFSVQPKTIRRALGPKLVVSNYSWPFIGAEAYDMMLRAYLARKKPPKLILVSFMPEYLSLPGKYLMMEGEDVRRIRAYNQVPTGALLSELAADGNYRQIWDWFAYVSMPPSSRDRDRLLPVLKSLAFGKGIPEPKPWDVEMVRGMQTDGAYLLFPDSTATPYDIERFLRIYNPVKLHDNREALGVFERFLKRASQAGIQVRLANMPIPEQTLEIYRKNGVLGRFDELVGRWERDYPVFRALRPAVYAYRIDQFGDFGHLNRRGDAKFQEDLRLLLERSLEAGIIPRAM